MNGLLPKVVSSHSINLYSIYLTQVLSYVKDTREFDSVLIDNNPKCLSSEIHLPSGEVTDGDPWFSGFYILRIQQISTSTSKYRGS